MEPKYDDRTLEQAVRACITDDASRTQLEDLSYGGMVELGEPLRDWLQRRGMSAEIAQDEDLSDIQLLFATWDALAPPEKQQERHPGPWTTARNNLQAIFKTLEDEYKAKGTDAERVKSATEMMEAFHTLQHHLVRKAFGENI